MRAFLMRLYIITAVGFFNLFLTQVAMPNHEAATITVLILNIPIMAFVWSRLPRQ